MLTSLRRLGPLTLLLLAACEVQGSVPVNASGSGSAAAPAPAAPAAPAATAAPAPFASKQGGPHGLALDHDHVYWANNTDKTIMKAPKAGGAPEKLATVPQNTDLVAVDDQTVFFTSWDGKAAAGTPTGKLWKVAKSGGTATELAGGMVWATSLAVDATHVYWTDTHSVNRMAKAGGAATKLNATYGEPEALVLDDQNAYFFGHSASQHLELAKMAKEGGAVTVLSPACNGQGFAIDATSAYFMRYEQDKRTLEKVAKTGGPIAVLGEARDTNRVQVAGGTVYALGGSDSAVWKESATGGPLTVITTVKHGGFGFVADETSLYWTSPPEGIVFKTPR